MKKPINVIFIGRSGAGKGTQAELLEMYLEKKGYKIVYLSTGEEMRKLKYKNNLSARLIKEKIIGSGNIAPKFLPVTIWGNLFLEKMDNANSFIFDGTPRIKEEAEIMAEALKFYDRKLIFPIWLDVERKEAIWRMKDRGRSDDTDKKIKNRLAFYKKNVVPVIRYYQKSPYRLIKIDGNPRDKELIHKNIVNMLNL